MRKVIGVVVAAVMCITMCVGFAGATDGSGLSSLLGDVDLSTLTDGELSNLLGDIANVDISGILLGNTSVGDAAGAVAADIDEIDLEETAGEVVSALLGDDGAAAAEQILNDESEGTLDIDSALSGLTNGNSDDFMSVISGAIESVGLGDALSGLNIGEFDLGAIVDQVLGAGEDTGDVVTDDTGAVVDDGGAGTPVDAVASNDFLAGLADTLLGGLQSIGIDTTVIEGLLDNEIVNFFANLYCGWNTGTTEEPTTEPTTEEPTTEEPTEPTTEAPTTEKVTTTQPAIHVKTGDTSSVMVAIGTLSVAAAAAFVCMKKKRA